MSYEREVLDLKIKFVMEGGMWSISYGSALNYANAVILGMDPDLDRFGTRIFKYQTAHDAYHCKSQRCYHPMDWKKWDWEAFRASLREEIRQRKKETVIGQRKGLRKAV